MALLDRCQFLILFRAQKRRKTIHCGPVWCTKSAQSYLETDVGLSIAAQMLYSSSESGFGAVDLSLCLIISIKVAK